MKTLLLSLLTPAALSMALPTVAYSIAYECRSIATDEWIRLHVEPDNSQLSYGRGASPFFDYRIADQNIATFGADRAVVAHEIIRSDGTGYLYLRINGAEGLFDFYQFGGIGALQTSGDAVCRQEP